MTEPTHLFESIGGCRVSVLRGGTGAPLLFLHGARGAGAWLPFFKTLAQHYEVLVPEHPGFGRSDTPEWLETIGDLANFYREFIDQLGLREVHLVGSSIGGWIAADLAARSTRDIATLTLIAAAGIDVPGVSRGDVFRWSPEQVARNLFADPGLTARMLAMKPDEEESARQAKNARTFVKLSAQERLYDPDLHKGLTHIDRPTLILWGDSDRLFPPQYGSAFCDLIPGSRLEVIKDCGHLPQVERAAETAALIKQFIAQAR